MILRRCIRLLKRGVFVCGVLFILLITASLSSLPWDWYRWLAHPESDNSAIPEVIVMMGGGGIPSESGLLRAWKTSEAAARFTNSIIIVAMPIDASESASYGIEYELQIRGVSPVRILREPNGRNTREQATEIYAMLERRGVSPIHRVGLVSSPEHMRRVWASFKKAGFTNLSTYPSWAEEIDVSMDYDEAEMSGRSLYGAVGGSMTLRYRLWDNLVLMVKCGRETAALVYYRLMGWV